MRIPDNRHLALAIALATVIALPAAAQTAPAQADPAAQTSSDGGATVAAPTLSDPLAVQQAAAQQQQAGSAGASVKDVIVTANRRAQTLQKVSASVQVLGGEALRQTGRNNLSQVLQQVPGVVVQGGPAGFLVSIRGIGLDQSPSSADAAVTISRDDVIDTNTTAAQVGFFDTARVEVLRGPQGTLYGRNATGGVVNVLSNDPTFTNGGYGQIEAGNYALIRGEGAINLAASDRLAFRLAGAAIKRDGYYSNGSNDARAESLRFKALFKPVDNVRLLGAVEYVKIHGRGAGDTILTTAGTTQNDPYQSVYRPFPPPGAAPRLYPNDSFYSGEALKFYGRVDVGLGFANLTVIPAHQSLVATNNYYVTGINIAQNPNVKQDSVETRLSAPDASPIKWTVGGFYYKARSAGNSISYDFTTTTATSGVLASRSFAQSNNNDTTARTYALFADVTVPVTSTLRLIGGVRQTWDRKHFIALIGLPTGSTNPAGFVLNQDAYVNSEHFDYRAVVEYDVAPDSLLYGKVATGYRAAGYSSGSLRLRNGVPTGQPVFAPEKLTSFEIGSKNRFFNRVLTINADAFYYDYKDYQAAASQVFAGSNSPISITDSANAKIYGGEVEGLVAVTPNDRLGGSVSYLHSEFTSFISPANAIYVGQALSKSPKWTITAGYDHTFNFNNGATLDFHVDSKYTSSYKVVYTSTIANGGIQNGQRKTNVNLSLKPYENAPFTVSAYIKNIENNATKNFIANVPAGGYVTLEAPRTFGGTVTARF